jgi:hypothetical protein
VLEIVGGAALGVQEDVLSGREGVEDLGVAGFEIIGVVALGEETIDPVDGIRMGFGVDLEEFVVVRGRLFDRGSGGRRGWRLLEVEPEAETIAASAGGFTGDDCGLRREGSGLGSEFTGDFNIGNDSGGEFLHHKEAEAAVGVVEHGGGDDALVPAGLPDSQADFGGLRCPGSRAGPAIRRGRNGHRSIVGVGIRETHRVNH